MTLIARTEAVMITSSAFSPCGFFMFNKRALRWLSSTFTLISCLHISSAASAAEKFDNPLSTEPISAEETKYWAKKKEELDIDPDVIKMRQAAAKMPPIKMQIVRVAPGMLPEQGGLAAGFIALTIDDGPTAANTRSLLRTLNDYSVKATFFHIGSRAEKNPLLCKLVVDEGQIVGSHTMHHAYMNKLTEEAAEKEFLAGQAAVRNACGTVAPFFRFPYGESTPELSQILAIEIFFKLPVVRAPHQRTTGH